MLHQGMSIPHFADLPIKDLLKVVNTTRLIITEKIDGSNIHFGLDVQGRFYTRRNKDIYYDVTEWPFLAWTNSFRVAHRILEDFVCTLELTSMILPGDEFSGEIIDSYQPNTLIYATSMADTIHLTSQPERLDDDGDYALVRHSFNGYVSEDVFVTNDGRSLEVVRKSFSWKISQAVQSRTLSDRTLGSMALFRTYLTKRLRTTSRVEPYTVEQVLNMKFNKRPDYIPLKLWQELLPQLRIERDLLNQELLDFKNEVVKQSILAFERSNTAIEGIVIRAPCGFLTKIVNKDTFLPANEFTHRVKYALVGGRRPARPCFLSRTKDWPVEKRLARLDVLLARYKVLRGHVRHPVTKTVSHASDSMMYGGPLHERTLLLFADLKDRISNGR